MEFHDELRAVLDILEDAAIDYAVCGGVAMALHGHPRFTEDIDILVLEGDAERAIASLAPLGFTLRAMPMAFNPGTASERRVRCVSKYLDRTSSRSTSSACLPLWEMCGRTETWGNGWDAPSALSHAVG